MSSSILKLLDSGANQLASAAQDISNNGASNLAADSVALSQSRLATEAAATLSRVDQEMSQSLVNMLV